MGEKAPNALKVHVSMFVFFLSHLHKVALSQYQQYHPLSLNILVDCQIVKCKLNYINRSLRTQDIWKLYYAVVWTKNILDRVFETKPVKWNLICHRPTTWPLLFVSHSWTVFLISTQADWSFLDHYVQMFYLTLKYDQPP